MRFSTKIFLTTSAVSVAAVLAVSASVYEVSKGLYSREYHHLYQQRLELVAREFVALEKVYQKVALNAGLVVRERSAKAKLSDQDFARMSKELNVDGISVSNSKGEFINGDYSESKNIFDLCPAYRGLTTGKSEREQTPLLPDVKGPSMMAWFTLIPTKDHTRVIDVRIHFAEVSQMLQRLANDESDIVGVSLRGSSGILLGEVKQAGLESMVNAEKISIKVPASVSDCCECRVRKLVSGSEPYTYEFTADVSLHGLNQAITDLKSRFAWIVSLLVLASLLLSLWVSRILLQKIRLIRGTVSEIEASKDFSKTIPVSSNPGSRDELNALAIHFNRMFGTMQDAQHELIEAKKTEARVAVASQVAHDIRSPLTSMTLALNQLQTEPSKTAEMISILSHGISRVNGILKRLSKKYTQQDTSAPVEAPRLTLVDKLLFDVAQEHALKIPNTQRFEITGFDAVPGVWSVVQVTELQTALSNILNNAFEAVGIDGTVRLNSTLEKNQLVVSIQDNGKGIPQEIINRVFDREFTSGKAEGSGLGLYQAKCAVEWCGGKIKIESKVNEGTTLTLLIPTEKTPAWSSDQVVMKRGQVLVVADDDPTILSAWRQKVTDADGISIREFSTIQALDESFASLGNLDNTVFILDQYASDGREGMTGIALIEKYSLGAKAYLSTSEFDDPAIQDKVKSLKTRMIPKPRLAVAKIVLSGDST